MNITYRNQNEYIPVDLGLLRPEGSYKYLMENRNHNIKCIVDKYGKIPQKLLTQRDCPTCNKNEYQVVYNKDHFDIVKCNYCELVYVNPIFNESHYQDTYTSEQSQEISKIYSETSHKYRVERFGNERVHKMKEYLHDGKINYLDIGCNTGFVVEAAQNNGWNATGIDLNPSAIKYGMTRSLNLYNISVENLKVDAESYDAISLFDVLEHVVNPKEIIKKSLQLLKPNGILYLYVPNWDSASRILLKEDAHFIWPTHHLTYYNIKTLTNLMALFNLKSEYTATEGLDVFDYIWYMKDTNKTIGLLDEISHEIQFFINAGGYGKNLRMLFNKPQSNS